MDSKKWEDLCVRLSDLLTEMEAVAQEICPQNVENIRNLSRLIVHDPQQTATLSAVSSEVTKRGRGRPRKPVEITIPLVPPSPATGYDGSLRPLPDKAPEIFLERKDKSENPIQFLNRVYGYWLGSGVFHIEDLNRLDRRLAPNLRSYCQQKKLNPQDFLPPPSPPKSAEEILAERRERSRRMMAERRAAALSMASSEVTKRGRGRPRKSVEVSGQLAPPSATIPLSLHPKLPQKAPEIFLERKDKSENPTQFIERVWGEYIRSGQIFLDDINSMDCRLVPNLRTFCTNNGLRASDFLPPPRGTRDRKMPAAEKLNELRKRDRERKAVRRARLKAGLF